MNLYRTRCKMPATGQGSSGNPDGSHGTQQGGTTQQSQQQPSSAGPLKDLPTNPDDKEDDEPFETGPRVHGGSNVILKFDGANYTAWRTCIFAALDAQPYALDAAMGTLEPPDPSDTSAEAKVKRRKYSAGNRAARCILFASIDTSLAVQLFADNAETVEACAMMRDLDGKFNKASGGLKQLAISKFMQYKYQQKKTAGENLLRFNTIISRMALLKVVIPDDLKITVLLDSLPQSWEPFRQAFTAREDSAKTVTHLIQAIENEALRRGQFETDEISALFSRLGENNGRQGTRNRRNGNRGGSNRNSGRRCYNCNRPGHVRAQCRAPRRRNTRGNSGGRGAGRGQERGQANNNYGQGHSSGQNQNQGHGSGNHQRHQSRNDGSRQHHRPQVNYSETQEGEAFIVEAEANNIVPESEYVVDSGTNFHMSNTKAHMISYTSYKKGRTVSLGGSRTLSAQGFGTARVTFICDGQPKTVQLNEVLFVPRLRKNLISMSKLTDDGFKIKVSKESIRLIQGKVAVRAMRSNGLYVLHSSPNPAEVNAADGNTKRKKVSLKDMHRTFAHVNTEWLKEMIIREGNEVLDDFVGCDDCTAAKMHQASYRSKPTSALANRIGYINADVCYVKTPSYSGATYFLVLCDSFSKYCQVYFLETRDEVYGCIVKFMRWFRHRTGQDIYHLHSDGAGEFNSDELHKHLESVGCDYSTSAPRIPQHNGEVERFHRTLLNLARVLIADSGLEKAIWVEAISFAAFVLNRIRVIKSIGKTPYEIITGDKPYLGRILRFGTRCYYLDRRTQTDKLDNRGIPGIIVGMDEDGLTYKVFDPETEKVIRIKEVTVAKESPLRNKENEYPPAPSLEKEADATKAAQDRKRKKDSSSKKQDGQNSTDPDDSSGVDDTEANFGGPTDNRPDRRPGAVTTATSRRSEKGWADRSAEREKRKYTDREKTRVIELDQAKNTSNVYEAACYNIAHENNNINVNSHIKIPTNLKEVRQSKDRAAWEAALLEEMNAMERHRVYDLVNLPPGRRAIGCRFVFAIKTDKDGNVSKYKARLVLLGYQQRPGIDYKELFSPVARFETIRSVLAIAAKEQLFLHQLDVKSAFLAAEIEEELYMKQPEGFDDGSGRVWRLKRALYGSVQAPRAFNQKMNRTLLDMKTVKLRQSSADPCLYFSEAPRRLVVLVFVDDAMVGGVDENIVKDFIFELGKTFELTSRPLDYFLGLHINISKDRRRIHVHQAKYITELLERFGMTQCKPSSTPIDNTSKSAFEGKVDEGLKFREAVGGLMYASTASRGDIQFATSFLSRYLDKPTRHLWTVVLKVFRYLSATKFFGPVYTSWGPNTLDAFTDADFAGCKSTFRSTSGSLISFGGGPLFWMAKKQGTTALNTLESELFAACETAKACIWLARLLREAGYNVKPTLLIDNSACISLIRNAQITSRSRHVQVRFCFVHEKVESGEFVIRQCASEDNAADLFTKPLDKNRFQKLRTLAGFVNDEDQHGDGDSVHHH